ncbi:M23 family metallopeptidase [Kushneria sp. TE3]|uniref:M23 family metallopeptidase n=1 Tax=Kushneria sp. TE3 TaxID=3449832 RepID=UPI003F682FDC
MSLDATMSITALRRALSKLLPALVMTAAFMAQPAIAETPVPIVFPEQVQQGSMVIGRVPPGSQVTHAGRTLGVTDYGTVVFGIGREAEGTSEVSVTPPGGQARTVGIRVTERDFPVERINGVPPKTVSPPPEIAERIRREQAGVSQARTRDERITDFAEDFIWPVKGRISGRFGNQRVYNGTPGSAHSGMDIAAATGTPVKAPAGGIVTFANPDLYLTGGTVLIDHGYGISSNFLHLSKLDVAVGDRVAQGDVIGEVGATGRATGPHLHWGMNWFDTRIDPLLVLERQQG